MWGKSCSKEQLVFHRCGDSTGWDQVDPEPALCQGLKIFGDGLGGVERPRTTGIYKLQLSSLFFLPEAESGKF